MRCWLKKERLSLEEIGRSDSKVKPHAKTLVHLMFEVLRTKFPTSMPAKMQEILNFSLKPGESLKASYQRLAKLSRTQGCVVHC